MTSLHTYHIPVMGTAFTAETPLRVAQYGINSVIALADDVLLERLRKIYSENNNLSYTEIKNNTIIGRGAEDMKGGLISVVHAISAIKKSKINLSGDLSLTSVIGHETPIGQKEGPKRLIELLKLKKMTPDAIVITEGPNAIWTAGMGFINFTITIHSEKGSMHTINTTFLENPIYLDETALLAVTAGAANDLSFFVSYEEITD